MKILIAPILILFSLGLQPSNAQQKGDTTRKKNDTTKTTVAQITELKFNKGETPVFKTDTLNLQLKKPKGSKILNASKNVEYPPGDPIDPTDPGDPPIDPVDPVDPGDPGNPPTSGSGVDAGRMAGGLDVSPTGAATYSIPLTLPPGLGKVVPQISVVYNSQAGNGTLGIGWNLSGLSAITRISATTFHDGFIGSTYWDSKDRFALDGQRLILKSGTYGGDGAEYQTESYSNIRIFSRGESGIGPDYFEVLMPDGSKAFYGLGGASETNMTWAITYSENPLGARISYYYNLSNNSLSISRIEYGSLGNAAGINKILFNYGYGSHGEQSYSGGTQSYNSSLLNKISVIANGNGFRNYHLSYNTVADLNYQRITAIQEYNGDETRMLQPVYFTYGGTGAVIPSSTISNFGISNIAATNSEVVTADFTGNGTMDLLWYNKTDKTKFYAFYDMVPNGSNYQWGAQVNTGAFTDIFPATWLTWNEKIIPGQGMLVVKKPSSNSYLFDMYSSGTVSPVYHQYNKVWDNTPVGPNYYSDCDFQEHTGVPLNMKFVSGDFNGDGLTDLIAVSEALTVTGESMEYYYDPYDDRASYYYCDQKLNYVTSSAYFINMDRRVTSNFVVSLGALSQFYINGEQLYTGDYNGDGKTDILHIRSGSMYVYSMNAINALELLWYTNDSRIALDRPILQGDYNGDGKMDIMFSTGNNSLFATFISTGMAFLKHEQSQPFNNAAPYWSPGAGSGYEVLRQYYLVANDVDGDGKTDIIRAETVTQNGVNGGTINLNIYHNLGVPSAGSAPGFGSSYSMSQFTNLKHNPIPLFLSPNNINYRPEFGFISDGTISLFKFQKEFRREVQVTGIAQDGINYSLTYNELNGTQGNQFSPVYEGGTNQIYPYIDHSILQGVYAVSKITRTYNGGQVSQVFNYKNAVSHAGGLGFLGFGELTRSNWHIDENDNNRIFETNIFDPQLRGALIRSFTSKSTYISPSIKYLALTTTSSSDGATLSDYIKRADQAYSSQLLANKVFVNVPVGTLEKDMLSGTFLSNILEYDGYYNLSKSTLNLNGAGSKISEATYDNNPSANYIGRLLTSKITNNNSSDSFSTEEQYAYSGFLPVQVKKKGNGTGWITDFFEYDVFGNVIQKITAEPGGAQRTTSMSYDPTGRFRISATNIEGMKLTSTYDNSTGSVLSVTNPYGQTSTTTYDAWGRVVSNTDFQGKSTTRSYTASLLGGVTTTEVNQEGSSVTTFVNVFGQKTGGYSKTIFGNYVGTAIEYDIYGRLYRESEPAQSGSANQWNYTSYDGYGRVNQTISFTGKTTNYSYSGVNVTVNDGTKSVTTTKNAMGQIVRVQDPGGTIDYQYYANGNIKLSDYSGIAQAQEQDGWGRKTKLIDPSAGIYEYQYDGWGQLIKESTPKGVTDITYDAQGKILKKKLTGDNTLMESDYTYDPTTKMLIGISMTNSDGNNTNYSYSYDSEMRLSSVVEDNLHARFTKNFTYDSFGRPSTESYEAKNKANNITANKTIEFQYQNGELLQTTLQGTGQIIWKVSAVDGKGNMTEAMQGTALKNTSQYDNYGLPQTSLLENVSSTPVTLMNLGYSFNAQRGLLNSRTNSVFNWSESFSYDTQNRLRGFNDNHGNNTQEYDDRGRITDNSQLGSYSYDGNTYRQSELLLNSGANPYYQNDRPLQQISFNAFKSPVDITEQGKERISFQYNASMGRAHMYFGDEQGDKMLRRYRRHYSEDGGMEITNDIITGQTSFIFYLTGDAYSAPAIWKEIHGSGQNIQSLYYLHRDYLGSIVMVTDDQGSVVEKRQFDAWGNIVKLQDGAGNNLSAFLILDRGYTGHEHLLGVGLINMNGRLYDPKLHRFLSPDNFIQDPYNTQNYNRYAYAMNNPLMFTDPNGEFLHLIIGAFIGGFVNWIANGAEFSWKGLGYFGVGAIAGALGAGVGAGVSSALAGTGFGAGFVGAGTVGAIGSGFLSGFTVGAAAGAAGGFAGGLGNGLIGGESFGRALGSGLKNGAWGAIGGGLVGGIAGGVDAALDGRDFWSGSGESYHELRSSIQSADGQYSSTADLRADYQQNIASRDGMRLEDIETKLKTSLSRADNTNVGSQYSVGDDGVIYGKNGHTVAGLTIPRYEGTFASKLVGTRIVIAPYVKSMDLPYRVMIIKHEMMHAWHNTFSSASIMNRYSERATSAYSLAFAKSYGLYSTWIDGSRSLVGHYPRTFSWRRFAQIIPLWINP
ncbi:RHS repeat-associated core domain-containing protein [Pedobacter suwonensis]|uniref:RHS repeat-associated core domain-containing protein n=1 Tax=Pedobacter suwonensis TaxID=332999 RepID=A0A1I0TXF5_9SPHI|nr:FG-GAP-like repeat-containing protein [Pedobacter suwonensis]SFA56511.1 RHS repeat-associated core domain-containing protein [Pedobacter suwonensis]